jgi:hypothetical protein
MFSRGGRGEDGGLFSVVIAVIALLALLGNSKRARRQARRASGSMAKGAGSMMLFWLIGGFLLFMGLMSLLSSIGGGAVAGLGFSFMFCLAPGAVLLFLGLAAHRAREEKERSARSASSSQTDATQPTPVQQKQPPAGVPVGRTIDQPAKPVPQAQAAPASAQRAAAKPAPVKAARKPIPEPVKNPADYRQRAIGYRRRIQSLIKSRRRGPLADLMAAILPKLEGWEARVGQLADRLTNFETDKLIQRDIKEVSSNIERMQSLWEAETDPATRKQIERTLAGYKEQQAQLDALTRLMRRTRFVLDDTLASMGTIYSQVQVLDAMDIDSARATRIGDEIQEQVDKLNDVLSAFSDVNQLSDDEVDDAARRIRLEKGGAAGVSS